MAGFLVALDSTSTRSEGGKAPRTTRARRIVQASEAVRKRAMTPPADRMTLTVPLGGHLHMRRLIWGGDPEEQPTAQGQSLGRGRGAHQRLQAGMVIQCQRNRAGKRHGHSQCPSEGRRRHLT